MKEHISITELAKMRNVTSETLRHYDRIGLFVPEHTDPYTGYRYYSKSQVEKFDTIMDLKKMGLRLNEIADFMGFRNIENSFSLLRGKENELHREIEEKQKLLLQIQQKMEYINICSGMDFETSINWEVKQYNRRKVIISNGEINNMDDFFYEFTRLRANLEDEYNMFGTNICGAVISREGFFDKDVKRLHKIPAIPEGMCNKDRIYGEHYELMEGVYFCCYGRGLLKAGVPFIGKINSILVGNGYEVIGDIYEREIIDASMTANEDELVYRLEIPVKKIKKRD